MTSSSPYRDLVIDESLVLWRGNMFKQHIPSKRHQFSFKIFVMCDCKTGYVQNIVLYTGDQTDRITGLSGAVVKTMMEKFLYLGHILYLDSWYTSPILARYLHQQATGVCGMVKSSRKHMVKVGRKLTKKEVVFYQVHNIRT